MLTCINAAPWSHNICRCYIASSVQHWQLAALSALRVEDRELTSVLASAAVLLPCSCQIPAPLSGA